MTMLSTWARVLWLWRHRWTALNVFLAAIPLAYVTLPADWLPSIPDWIKAGLAVTVLLSAGAQRVAKIVPKDLPPP
jgi:hypothetical protein